MCVCNLSGTCNRSCEGNFADSEYSSVGKHLPGMCEVLGSVPATAKMKVLNHIFLKLLLLALCIPLLGYVRQDLVLLPARISSLFCVCKLFSLSLEYKSASHTQFPQLQKHIVTSNFSLILCFCYSPDSGACSKLAHKVSVSV